MLAAIKAGGDGCLGSGGARAFGGVAAAEDPFTDDPVLTLDSDSAIFSFDLV